MLVLTRKADEQIMIGDEIKISVVRIRGNSVRIGIDAPQNVRIVRGELESLDRADPVKPAKDQDHVQVAADRQSPAVVAKVADKQPTNRLQQLLCDRNVLPAGATKGSIYVGRVPREAIDNRSGAGPLAKYMSPR